MMLFRSIGAWGGGGGGGYKELEDHTFNIPYFGL